MEPLSREERLKQGEVRNSAGKPGIQNSRSKSEKWKINKGSIDFCGLGVTASVTLSLNAMGPITLGSDTVDLIAFGTNTISIATADSITIGPISNEANEC